MWTPSPSTADMLPQKLVIGLLKTTRYPEIASRFMAYATSPEGRAIFEKYGLYHGE